MKTSESSEMDRFFFETIPPSTQCPFGEQAATSRAPCNISLKYAFVATSLTEKTNPVGCEL